VELKEILEVGLRLEYLNCTLFKRPKACVPECGYTSVFAINFSNASPLLGLIKAHLDEMAL